MTLSAVHTTNAKVQLFLSTLWPPVPASISRLTDLGAYKPKRHRAGSVRSWGPRTQTGPTLGFCLSGCRGSPALLLNTAPLGRGGQMSLAQGQGKGGGQLTDGNPTANLPNVHVHTSWVGSHHVSPRRRLGQRPVGYVGPCTAGPTAWHAQAAIPAVLTSSCRSQLEALLKEGV